MLMFECRCAKLCFLTVSFAVFAQYEDHLSVYDWCPDQTLWDWLPGVAVYLLSAFQRSTVWDSGSLPGRLPSWHNPVYGSCQPLSQSETWKQAIWDNYLRNTPVQCSESPACSFEQTRPEQVHLKTVVVVIYGNTVAPMYSKSQNKSFWTDWIRKCFFFHIFLYSGGLHGYDNQYGRYFCCAEAEYDPQTLHHGILIFFVKSLLLGSS